MLDRKIDGDVAQLIWVNAQELLTEETISRNAAGSEDIRKQDIVITLHVSWNSLRSNLYILYIIVHRFSY